MLLSSVLALRLSGLMVSACSGQGMGRGLASSSGARGKKSGETLGPGVVFDRKRQVISAEAFGDTNNELLADDAEIFEELLALDDDEPSKHIDDADDDNNNVVDGDDGDDDGDDGDDDGDNLFDDAKKNADHEAADFDSVEQLFDADRQRLLALLSKSDETTISAEAMELFESRVWPQFRRQCRDFDRPETYAYPSLDEWRAQQQQREERKAAALEQLRARQDAVRSVRRHSPYGVYHMSFQGYEIRLFVPWVEKVALMARMIKTIDAAGPVLMPTRRNMVTPITSPHKFHTSQEHWVLERHRRMVRVEGPIAELEKFVACVKQFKTPAVSMRIVRRKYYPLDQFYTKHQQHSRLTEQ